MATEMMVVIELTSLDFALAGHVGVTTGVTCLFSGFGVYHPILRSKEH